MDELTPSDFSVRISNIPEDNHNQLKKCIENTYKNVEVAKITFCYNSTKVEEIEEKI